MTDAIIFPGTEMEVNEKYPDSWRLDHHDFSDVSKTTFAKGVIIGFHAASEDVPLIIKDCCDIEVDGEPYTEVPIFYHIPKAYAEHWKENTEQQEHWQAGGSLDEESKTICRGVYSFLVGDEVVIMLHEGVPVAVIGFADGVLRRPHDYMQVDIPAQIMEILNGEPVDDPLGPYNYTIQLSNLNREDGSSPNGPDGFALNLTKEATALPDIMSERTGSSSPDFWIDNASYYAFYGDVDPDTYTARKMHMEAYPNRKYDPDPSDQFGPFYGYFRLGIDPWSVDIPDWATYKALWLDFLDTVQSMEKVGGSWVNRPYLGLWGEDGRPDSWGITASESEATGITKFGIRSFVIEIGPRLYVARMIYQQYDMSGSFNLYVWKDRVAWPSYGFSPPVGWSGFPDDDTSLWTAPMWPASPNPYPTCIEECVPPPDLTFNVPTSQENFFSDNNTWLFSAPCSKELLEKVADAVAASSATLDPLNGVYDSEPPEGFKQEQFWQFEYAGNLREISFKTAEKKG
jgi:hypothetical protein